MPRRDRISGRAATEPRLFPRLAALSLLAVVCALLPRAASAKEERLIGWLGEVARPRAGDASQAGGDKPTGESAELTQLGYWIEPVSWYPRAFHLHNFMSHEECDRILEIARPRVRRSTVIDSVTGQSKVDPIRTSEQTFLNRGSWDIVTKVEERLAVVTQLPAYHGEDMQILKYGLGQKYDAHHDVGELTSASGKQLAAEGGHRVATVLLYLSDVEEGGETAFPDSEWMTPELRKWAEGQKWSDCAEGNVAVKPRKGDGLLFWSVNNENAIDPHSMHAGCPVIRGEKWTATKWIHARPFRWTAPPPPKAPPGCDNKHELCKAWANAGECKKNPGFMLQDCKWACKACDVGFKGLVTKMQDAEKADRLRGGGAEV